MLQGNVSLEVVGRGGGVRAVGAVVFYTLHKIDEKCKIILLVTKNPSSRNGKNIDPDWHNSKSSENKEITNNGEGEKK